VSAATAPLNAVLTKTILACIDTAKEPAAIRKPA
jgi:hypothetical protein